MLESPILIDQVLHHLGISSSRELADLVSDMRTAGETMPRLAELAENFAPLLKSIDKGYIRYDKQARKFKDEIISASRLSEEL